MRLFNHDSEIMLIFLFFFSNISQLKKSLKCSLKEQDAKQKEKGMLGGGYVALASQQMLKQCE